MDDYSAKIPIWLISIQLEIHPGSARESTGLPGRV